MTLTAQRSGSVLRHVALHRAAPSSVPRGALRHADTHNPTCPTASFEHTEPAGHKSCPQHTNHGKAPHYSLLLKYLGDYI